MEIVKNEAQKQYELPLGDGAVAFVEYVTEGNKIYLTHTEVPKSHQGQGIAKKLIHGTLGQIKADGNQLVPLCSFVSSYVNNHEQWHSLLSEGYQM